MPYICDAPKDQKVVVIPKKDSPFKKSTNIMSSYERALRGLASQIGKFIKGYLADDPLNPDTSNSLNQALKTYSDIIGPWALNLVSGIIGQVDNQDKFAWRQHSKNMSIALRKELDQTDTGDIIKQLLQQNVLLIKSIPVQAAQRVNKLVQENMMQSRRASDIAEEIMQTEYVTKSRATLIARTEISKASGALTQARALGIGSEGYIWRTAGDAIVRKSHRAMNGKFVRWDSPPPINEGTDKAPRIINHHAGDIWNCRCYMEPEIPEG